MLISVLVNRIYLSDNEITYIFNAETKPVTVTLDLLNEIEQASADFKECSNMNSDAPPKDSNTQVIVDLGFCI